MVDEKSLNNIKGIGVDITLISRIEKDEQRIAKYILTSNEYQQYLQSDHKTHFLAGRWASKEAFVKAKGGNIKDYEILNDENGKPICKDGLVSISHDGDYAISFVVVK